MLPLPKRRSLVALVALATVTLLAVHLTLLSRPLGSLRFKPGSLDAHLDPATGAPEKLDPHEEQVAWLEAHLVNGPPTASFRENLRSDTKYITSWASAGWTNDVITYANLIYLGVITDRVPILPMFTPSHIGGDAAPIPFGEVFDIARFVKESGIQVLEWDEVKDPQSEFVDDLGCWNIWEAVQYREHFPRRSSVPGHLGIDVSYTRAPDWIKTIPNYEHDLSTTFWSLARLSFPEERARNLGNTLPSPIHNTTLDPDQHLLCYDYLYYVGAQQSAEYEHDYAPMWRYVMKYMHFTDRIEAITSFYLREILELPSEGEIPPYIAIHVRHGDFSTWCWAAEDPADCFAPISVIARRVSEVQAELRELKGIDVPASHVILTSDEKDPAWWDEIHSLGWRTVDHAAARTSEVFGRWYPLIVDAAIQSRAVGFVGTDRSTYSIMSRRRVESWNEGVVRTVMWGFKGADDH